MKKKREVTYSNNSPWIEQLKDLRKPRDSLNKSIETEVTIIGGGIAGVMTSYFLLTQTRKKVVLVEAHKVAHGATGHNAGQIVSYFEKPFSEIVEEYGLELATRGQEEILEGWNLIEDIYENTKIGASMYNFIGYAGCNSIDQLIQHLENKRLRKLSKIKIDEVFVSSSFKDLKKIPKKYKGLFKIAPQEKIKELLETKDNSYIAALASKKGCLNSAAFTEQIAGYLIEKYPSRFSLYEFTPVNTINLYEKHAILKLESHEIKSNKVVLCTNGFENIEINNFYGDEINSSFHESVIGVVGYMAGYIEKEQKKSTAISYFSKSNKSKNTNEAEPYIYMTRRPYYYSGENSSLICIGGPEVHLEDKKTYIRDRPYFQKRQDEIDLFLKKTYPFPKNKKINYSFHWHGLMGYTKSGLRLIGPSKQNKNLLFNLGCNGVGILPSIYGGYKIARFISNIKLPKSIFDPQ